MNRQEYILWSDTIINKDCWEQYVRHECPHLEEAALANMIYELNHDLLDQLRNQLNIQLNKPILMICHDKPTSPFAYQFLSSGNIRDCLMGETQNTTWYVDANGDFHRRYQDGNKQKDWTYRAFRDGVSEEQIIDMKTKLLEGTFDWADLYRLTRRLGPFISSVLNYSFPEAPSRMLVL